MYQRILVTLDHSPADEAILQHIEQLQQHIKSEILLLHVADGWAARYHNQLKLKDSEEMKQDRAYLEKVAARLQKHHLTVKHHLALGNPADEIIAFAEQQNCDLIAMSTHGHRLLQDIIYGSTATKVRHSVQIPVLLVKATKKLL